MTAAHPARDLPRRPVADRQGIPDGVVLPPDWAYRSWRWQQGWLARTLAEAARRPAPPVQAGPSGRVWTVPEMRAAEDAYRAHLRRGGPALTDDQRDAHRAYQRRSSAGRPARVKGPMVRRGTPRTVASRVAALRAALAAGSTIVEAAALEGIAVKTARDYLRDVQRAEGTWRPRSSSGDVRAVADLFWRLLPPDPDAGRHRAELEEAVRAVGTS